MQLNEQELIEKMAEAMREVMRYKEGSESKTNFCNNASKAALRALQDYLPDVNPNKEEMDDLAQYYFEAKLYNQLKNLGKDDK